MGLHHDTTLPSSLLAHLATIPDPRSPRGRRYEWLYLLTLLVAAMMTGENNPTGINDWVSAHHHELVESLQPARRCVPRLSTLRRALCAISLAALEQAIGAYLQGLANEMGDSGQIETLTGERLAGQAVDGKTVRCATAYNAIGEKGAPGPATHLVAVAGHEHGMVWAQENAPAKLDERMAATPGQPKASPLGESAPHLCSPLAARINWYGAYDFTHGQALIWHEGKCNSEQTVQFLQQLYDWQHEMGHAPNQRIVVIWDGAPWHRSHVVRQQAERLGIEIIQLPANSPDLNPIEGLWKWMRTEVMQHFCHASLQDSYVDCQAFIARINLEPLAMIDRLWPRFELDPDYEQLLLSN